VSEPTPLSRYAAQAIIDNLDEEWYCLNCGRPRPIEAWGKPCECGDLAHDVLAEQEDQPERGGDSGHADVVPESSGHGSPSTRSAGR
jgi:hypothetical protein